MRSFFVFTWPVQCACLFYYIWFVLVSYWWISDPTWFMPWSKFSSSSTKETILISKVNSECTQNCQNLTVQICFKKGVWIWHSFFFGIDIHTPFYVIHTPFFYFVVLKVFFFLLEDKKESEYQFPYIFLYFFLPFLRGSIITSYKWLVNEKKKVRDFPSQKKKVRFPDCTDSTPNWTYLRSRSVL